MGLSMKTVLVFAAGVLGFAFGTAALADECASGLTYNWSGGVCNSVTSCYEADYAENYAFSGFQNVSAYVKEEDGGTGGIYQNICPTLENATDGQGCWVKWKHLKPDYYRNSGEPRLPDNYSIEQTHITISCNVVPDPEPDTCSAQAGNEESFTSQDLYTIAGCVNGCLVSSSGGGRVQVQIEGADGTVYTSGNYTGAACAGDESQYSKVVDADNPPYKMELINGVPTFTANGTTIKLASDNNGAAGNITSQMEQLNPDLALDIKNSSGSTGEDGSPDESINADTVLQVTNVNNVTNVNTSGYQVGYNSADPSGTGTGTGGETGGETGGDTTVNVDLSGVESKLDGIQETLDGIGEGVEFSGDEVGTFGSITSNFVAEVQGTGFIQAANNISFPTGAGTCPSFGVSVLGGNVSTTTHCEIWDSVKGVLSTIMLFVYAVFGIRTVMSA